MRRKFWNFASPNDAAFGNSSWFGWCHDGESLSILKLAVELMENFDEASIAHRHSRVTKMHVLRLEFPKIQDCGTGTLLLTRGQKTRCVQCQIAVVHV